MYITVTVCSQIQHWDRSRRINHIRGISFRKLKRGQRPLSSLHGVGYVFFSQYRWCHLVCLIPLLIHSYWCSGMSLNCTNDTYCIPLNVLIVMPIGCFIGAVVYFLFVCKFRSTSPEANSPSKLPGLRPSTHVSVRISPHTPHTASPSRPPRSSPITVTGRALSSNSLHSRGLSLRSRAIRTPLGRSGSTVLYC